MDMNSCTIGKRVALLSQIQPCQKGTIKSAVESHKTHGHVVIVEWDNGSIQKVTTRSLITEEEGVAQDKRLAEESARLEREFQKAQAIVAEKMKEAADAINSALQSAEAAGADIQEMYEATRPLMNALDNAGWSTSSFSC